MRERRKGTPPERLGSNACANLRESVLVVVVAQAPLDRDPNMTPNLMKFESIGQAPRAGQGLQNIAPVEAPCVFLVKITLPSRRRAFFEVRSGKGTLEGLSWIILGMSWACLGSSWACLGSSWACFGPVLGHLGTILGYWGLSSATLA